MDTDYPKDDTRYDWDSNGFNSCYGGSIAVTEVPASTTEFLLIVEWRIQQDGSNQAVPKKDSREDDLVANITEDVGGSGNTLPLDEINITAEENLELNLGNNRDGENRELSVGSPKDGEERTTSQILVNLQRRMKDKDENCQISGSTQNSGKKRLCDFTPPNFNLLSLSDLLNDLAKVCTLPFVNPTQTEITRVETNEEGDQSVTFLIFTYCMTC
nr:hypothetical protein [Tanacetum cinerariifolium]